MSNTKDVTRSKILALIAEHGTANAAARAIGKPKWGGYLQNIASGRSNPSQRVIRLLAGRHDAPGRTQADAGVWIDANGNALPEYLPLHDYERA